MGRLRNLQKSLQINRLEGLVLTNSLNITYLTGFESEDSWLLVGLRQVVYITDARYTLMAKKGMPKGVSVQEHQGNMPAILFARAQRWGITRLGFEECDVTVAQFKHLKKQKPSDIKLVGVRDVVENLRVIKDANELAATQEALNIHLQAHRYLKRVIKPGVREKEILEKLERFVKARHATFSFDPIIASGPNSCYPHAKVTDRRIRANELVLVDMGIEWKGYKSDLTRIFFLGKISPFIRSVYDAVHEANRQAIKHIRPGVPAKTIDAVARDYLAQHKLVRYFGHALGHGVGLEIHENPRLSQHSNAVLTAGMIVTIEPGVYLPERFGIRVEDMILVTDSSCEILSDHIY